MYFASNIRQLRNRRHRTQDDISTALGMKRSTLSGYENGIAQPSIEALVAFSKYFNVAIDTLIRVNLSELSESQLSQLERGFDVYIKGSNLRVLATTVDGKNNENIELVPKKAKAGYRNGFADPEFISTLPVFQLPFLSHNKKYRTFQLTGDSMMPIPDGSWVTGEYVQDWNHLITGHGYIILTLDDGIMFKIIENKINEEQKLILYSLNPEYEAFPVHISEVKELWKFTHYISSDLPDPVLPQQELTTTVASMKKELDKVKKIISGIKKKNG